MRKGGGGVNTDLLRQVPSLLKANGPGHKSSLLEGGALAGGALSRTAGWGAGGSIDTHDGATEWGFSTLPNNINSQQEAQMTEEKRATLRNTTSVDPLESVNHGKTMIIHRKAFN